MADLSNTLWIGGPAGAGKTTVARLLARRHGLRLYSSDTRTWEHRDRAIAAGVELPERGPGSGYDRGPMIIDDLRALPSAPLIVAEGGPVTPQVAAVGGEAVWLVPSRAAQAARLGQRHPDGAPEAYLRSWDPIVEQLAGADVWTLTVDDLTVAETITEVEHLFADRLAEGPTAKDPAQRRALIRYANQALVRQYTSPSSKPKVPGDPTKTSRVFDCECAAPTCSALVTLSISDAAAAVAVDPPSILALEHRAG